MLIRFRAKYCESLAQYVKTVLTGYGAGTRDRHRTVGGQPHIARSLRLSRGYFKNAGSIRAATARSPLSLALDASHILVHLGSSLPDGIAGFGG